MRQVGVGGEGMDGEGRDGGMVRRRRGAIYLFSTLQAQNKTG